MAAPAAAAARVKWQPSDYAFNPYELTAQRLTPACEDKAISTGEGAAGKAGGKAGVDTAPVKRRPGRQKRTSVLCQVPGCDEELVDAKKYYRRYRICQLHCNMPSMMIEGRRQRFCQQCGRFHDIGEFEGAKRSCKRKLKRHNERRRTSMTSAAKKTWHSDSEAEADEAYNESSGSEAKVASATKRRAQRPAGKKQAPPVVVLPPRAKEVHTSGDCSAASQNTGSGGIEASLAADSPSAGTACAQAQSLAPAHPAMGCMQSLSGSMDTCVQRADTAEAQTEAGDLPGVESPEQVAAVAAPPLQHSQHTLMQQPQQLHLSPPEQRTEQQQSPQAMDVQASPAATSAPSSPLPATALASAHTGSAADADLDTVLQQLLHDEDLQGLQLDPLEMFLPQDGSHMPVKAEPTNSQEIQPAVVAPSAWGAQQMVQAPQPMQGAAQFARASLADLPMELLDDIPLIPLPEELRPSTTATVAAPSTAASGRSGAASEPTPSASGASDMAGLPLGSVEAVPWQQPQWHMPPAAAPRAPPQPMLVPQQQALPPHSVAPSVLASTQTMISMPGMVAGGMAAPLVGYGVQPSQYTLTTLSLKVFSCTPDQLLPAVRQELEGLLNVGQTLLEGYIRPGCTQLTLNALMPQKRIAEVKARGLGSLVSELLATCGSSDVLQQDMLVQFEGELAVVKRRKVVALIALKNSPGLVPALDPLLPVAVYATADAPAASPLLLRGSHLTDERDLILARQQGNNLTVEMHASGTLQSGEYVKVRVLGLLPGFADVEVQHGTFLSAPRALVVLPCAAAVAEVRQLERCTSGIECLDDLLRDMGLVVQWLQRHELQAEGQGCPHYTPTLLACIAAKARRLVAAATARGWTATVKMLLPAVTADGQSGDEAIAGMNACCPSAMSLLHVAVGTGSVPLVRELAAWAACSGCCWEVDARGGNSGITPLHVAALLPNSKDMRAALAGMAPATIKLWGLVQADDGTTPEALAEALLAAAAAAKPPSGSPGSSCSSEGTMEGTAFKGASTSKAGALTEGDLPTMSSSSQAAPLQEAGASKSKGTEEGEVCQSPFASQRRRGRQAIKQHLDDMHMTTILSEVESGLDSIARDPRPLADVLSTTIAAGSALLRALRRH